MDRRTVLWMLAAIAGIVLTAAVTWATSQLTSQHIGLSSEPLSAGHGLAPAVVEQSTPRHSRGTAKTTPTLTRPATTTRSERTTGTSPEAPRVTTSPSTSTATETPLPTTPRTQSPEPAEEPSRSRPSGDDGGANARQKSGEARGGEGGQVRSSRERDD